MKIVSIGEATADTFVTFNRTLAGGISLNFAVQARRCGADHVSLIAAVGRDAHGRLILEKLVREGIDASHVAIVDEPTACCEIVTLAGGERHFPPHSYHQNCMATFALAPADLAFARTHDIAVSRFDRAFPTTYFDQVMFDMLFAGRRAADFGSWHDYTNDYERIFPYLPQVDIAFISGDEATIAALARPAAVANTLLVVTRGPAGSSALLDNRRIDQPVVPVSHIVDTTGAGDAFQAAFVVTYFRHLDPARALLAGAHQAARTLTHVGATPT